ncbi:MAG: hypothetical protein NT154_08260 [Verrucomicrobia bacterium]|nr:hypothetical protein [Verrucomicrobiota bacterium]
MRTISLWTTNLILSLVLTGSVRAASQGTVWFTEPRTNALNTNALVLIAQPSGTSYVTRTITWSNLSSGLVQSFTTNFFTTNLFTTNLYPGVVNTSNFYTSNYFAEGTVWTNSGAAILPNYDLPVVLTNPIVGNGGTMYGPMLSLSPTTNYPAPNEFITPSYLDARVPQGVVLYLSQNELAQTNPYTSPTYQLSGEVPSSFTHVFDPLSEGQYLECFTVTNLHSVQGPILASLFLCREPSPPTYDDNLYVQVKIFWSTNNGATLEGGYLSNERRIDRKFTFSYDFITAVPNLSWRLPATLYVFITNTRATVEFLQVFGGISDGNTWPSKISFNTTAGGYADYTIIQAGDTYTSNSYAKTLYSTSNTFARVTVTNGISFATNSWSGPTNTVDLQPSCPYDLNYASATSCEITGFTVSREYRTAEALLSIANTATNNITVTLPAEVADGDYTRTHTITNGTTGMFWLRYTPQGPRTNCVFRQM